MVTAGYKITESWLTLDSRKWGFRLATLQKVGVSLGTSSDPDGIYIVCQGQIRSRYVGC